MIGRSTRLASAGMLSLIVFVSAMLAQRSGSEASAPEDPVLRAMKTELERSKSQLKLEQMAAPYYIDYRIVDMQARSAEAAFGALRTNLLLRIRFLRATVRVGDYKQDSFFGQGEGVVEYVPVDDDELALRHHLWLATDRAYKAAMAALTAKQAQLKQYKVDQPVDDFAHADPLQFIRPLAKLDADPAPWLETIQEASALYRTDPEIQSATALLEFHTLNHYFVSSEGTVVRTGRTTCQVLFTASTQASDGMQLVRTAAYPASEIKELPARDKFLARARELAGTLKDLRAAPLADEEYRGPVLFSADAASTVFADLVGENILGRRPNLGQPARVRGAFSSSYKSRVLPDFLSVTDDPTLTSLGGKPLIGHYEVDDEGVKAARVPVIEQGKLVNYLLGRQPIRDFSASNGHGRAALPTNPPGPSLGNMIVTGSDTLSPDELKKKLIEMCRQRDLAYGYYVETMAGLRDPRLVYRLWVKDGREELVRGAVFGDLDVRALRNNLVAAGDDVYVANEAINIPHSIVSPSILFDELEVKRADKYKSALPEYPPPPVSGE
jgi:predicted Zn-dependent protease